MPESPLLPSLFQRLSLVLFVVFFTIAGAMHFISPATYLPLMPRYLPWHLPLIYVSGLAEVAGGLGLIFLSTRRLAAWGLIALLLAVFPANIHMLMNEVPLGGQHVAPWIFWLRLPLQFVLIAWIYTTCVARVPSITSPARAASDFPSSP